MTPGEIRAGFVRQPVSTSARSSVHSALFLFRCRERVSGPFALAMVVLGAVGLTLSIPEETPNLECSLDNYSLHHRADHTTDYAPIGHSSVGHHPANPHYPGERGYLYPGHKYSDHHDLDSVTLHD